MSDETRASERQYDQLPDLAPEADAVKGGMAPGPCRAELLPAVQNVTVQPGPCTPVAMGDGSVRTA